MNRYLIILGLFFAPILRGSICAQKITDIVPLLPVDTASTERAGWELIFGDEFNGDTLDRAKWWAQEGKHGDELQYYTNRKENVYIADGVLHLKARVETFKDSMPYTSGEVFSSKQFGKGHLAEVRCKIPKGQGLWPAFWFWLGSGDVYQEVDGFEFWSENTRRFCTTNHWGNPATPQAASEFRWIKPRSSEGKRLDMSNDFYTYGTYWDDSGIRFLLNGQLVAVLKKEIPAHPMSLILNLAVSGGRDKPKKQNIFPADFQIDYVRIYARRK